MGARADMTYDLSGKSIVVTGATSGIGLAAVKKLVNFGAFVIGVGRSETRLHNAFVQIDASNPKGEAAFLLADLAVQDQIKSLCVSIAKALASRGFSHLDVLVNNAGVYLEKKHLTGDGLEKTFAVNHLAPFIITHCLNNLLQQADSGRVLTVSSYSHRTTPLNLNRITNPKPYIGLLAYKRSKLCNVLFTHALNSKGGGITAFAVDPGLVNTGIASKGSQGLSHWIWRFRRQQGTTAEVPAKTILYLSGESQIDISHGVYIKDCQPTESSRKAKRKGLANELWDLSCELTGIDW